MRDEPIDLAASRDELNGIAREIESVVRTQEILADAATEMPADDRERVEAMISRMAAIVRRVDEEFVKPSGSRTEREAPANG